MANVILYIMTTSVPGLIKIGKTTPDKYDSLMHKFSVNGYANVFGLKPYYKRVFDPTISDPDGILLWLEKYRIGELELYAMPAAVAKQTFIPKKRKKPFSMYKLGIKNGDILTFVGDPSIKVTVVGERKVEYKGIVYGLSQLTLKLYEEKGKTNKSRAYMGANHFTFNDTLLTKLPIKN